MDRAKIKYILAVAAVVAAAALCACADDDDIVPIEGKGAYSTETGSDPAAISPKEDNNEDIRVYVCGAVKDPGVYTMSPESRAIDAINEAGGLKDNAGSDYINLAAKLSDGQKLYIPTIREIEEALEGGAELYGAEVNITANTPGIERIETGQNGNDNNGMVDINTADKATLMTLPGIGESKADKIIAYLPTQILSLTLLNSPSLMPPTSIMSSMDENPPLASL